MDILKALKDKRNQHQQQDRHNKRRYKIAQRCKKEA